MGILPNSNAFYHILTSNRTELTYNSKRKISKIIDQSLSQDHGVQNNNSL